MDQLDLDGDGNLDYEEWITCAIDHKKIVTLETITNAYHLFDRTGKGYIDIHELVDKLPTTNKSNMKPENHDGVVKDEFVMHDLDKMGLRKTTLKKYYETVDVEEQQRLDTEKWLAIIADVEHQDEGIITFKEFKNAIEQFISSSYSIIS